MTELFDDQQVKMCCTTFYQSDLARTLFGDIFHPGGLPLTRHIGDLIGLCPADHALDVACGRGPSAIHLAESFGCRVTGLDFGQENIAAAEANAARSGATNLTAFRQGDAGRLPFDDGVFDAVVSECSFCTFADKLTAAYEMARVLRTGGRLGLADMTISSPLPDDIQSLLAWVACIAGADTPDSYIASLAAAGFADFQVEDRRDELLEMVDDTRRKLMGVELAVGMRKLDLGDTDLNEGKRLARRVLQLIKSGDVGYVVITAKTR